MQMEQMQASLDALKLATPSSSRPRSSPPNPKVKGKPHHQASDSDPGSENEADSNSGGENELSEAAKKQRLRRLCERKVSGKISVPEEIHAMWQKGGHHREELSRMFEEAGFDKEGFGANIFKLVTQIVI